MESLPDAPQPEVPGTPMAPQVSGKNDEPVDLGIPMYTLFWDQSLWRSNQTFLDGDLANKQLFPNKK